MLNRRGFLKYTGGTTLALFAYNKFGVREAVAAIPGGTLDPATIPKFVTPMLIPPVMPRAGTIKLKGGKNADYYEISMKQFPQQILPAGLPADDRLGLRRRHGRRQARAASCTTRRR